MWLPWVSALLRFLLITSPLCFVKFRPYSIPCVHNAYCTLYAEAPRCQEGEPYFAPTPLKLRKPSLHRNLLCQFVKAVSDEGQILSFWSDRFFDFSATYNLQQQQDVYSRSKIETAVFSYVVFLCEKNGIILRAEIRAKGETNCRCCGLAPGRDAPSALHCA